MLKSAGVGILLLFTFSVLTAAAQGLPNPQIASAEGKVAPDFTLKDQFGNDFRLSSERGRRVLLVFYRGYW